MDKSRQNAVDILIVGAGPAGRWLAAHLCLRGVNVALSDPSIDERWPNNYGLWIDEIEDLQIEVDLQKTWPRAVVRLPNRGDLELNRAYGRLDKERFRRRLDEILDHHGVARHDQKIGRLEHRENSTRAHSDDGRMLEARLVVDASGGRAGLLEMEDCGEPAFQTAYGLDARLRGDPLEGSGIVLMDYHHSHKSGLVDDAQAEVPTFLYAMALSQDRYFIEETALVARPALSIGALQENLHRRLLARGVVIEEIFDEEICRIPMGGPLPRMGQRTLAFGASAGFVHPATGYQMARMLRAGSPLADVIAAELKLGTHPDSIARRAWNRIWPASQLRARSLFLFGQEILLGANRRQISLFFQTFFDLPPSDWQAYMSSDSSHQEVAKAMLRLFAQAPMQLRFNLARSALGDVAPLLRAYAPMPTVGVRR